MSRTQDAPSPDTHPDHAATWWESHLQALTEHEQDLYQLQERRAQWLAGLCGTIAGAGVTVFGAAGMWAEMRNVAALLVGLGFMVLLASAVVFWITLTPMEGRRFRPGSLAHWLHGRLLRGREGEGPWGLLPIRAVGGIRDLRHAQRIQPDLSTRVRQAAREDDCGQGELARSPRAREQVRDFLQATLSTDLSWWLGLPAGEDPLDETLARRLDARLRMVFWFWSNRQIVESKADLVRLGLWLSLVAVGLLTLGALVQLLHWWLLLLAVVVLLAAGAWVVLAGGPPSTPPPTD